MKSSMNLMLSQIGLYTRLSARDTTSANRTRWDPHPFLIRARWHLRPRCQLGMAWLPFLKLQAKKTNNQKTAMINSLKPIKTSQGKSRNMIRAQKPPLKQWRSRLTRRLENQKRKNNKKSFVVKNSFCAFKKCSVNLRLSRTTAINSRFYRVGQVFLNYKTTKIKIQTFQRMCSVTSSCC